jgi:hypothetical protein
MVQRKRRQSRIENICVQGCKDKCFGVFLLCEAFEACGPYPFLFSLHRIHDCVGINVDACKLFSLIMARGMELKTKFRSFVC